LSTASAGEAMASVIANSAAKVSLRFMAVLSQQTLSSSAQADDPVTRASSIWFGHHRVLDARLRGHDKNR
jgi:hypothetical protein